MVMVAMTRMVTVAMVMVRSAPLLLTRPMVFPPVSSVEKFTKFATRLSHMGRYCRRLQEGLRGSLKQPQWPLRRGPSFNGQRGSGCEGEHTRVRLGRR